MSYFKTFCFSFLFLPSIALASENLSVSLPKIYYAQNRIGFGVSPQTTDIIVKVGLDNWIKEQLLGENKEPDFINTLISNMDITKKSQTLLLKELHQDPRFSATQKGNVVQYQQHLIYEIFKRNSIRAIYSPNQLRERMTWFWFNHFNVEYIKKRGVDKFLADYMENTIHNNSLGNFKTMLRAVIEHPSMSYYLDNYLNTDLNSPINKHLPKERKLGSNENYARELLELHTLGQGNGYTQNDVQELARVLTGFGLRDSLNENVLKSLGDGFVFHDYFLFDPRRHDFGDKVFMGKHINGSGYPELEKVLDILVKSPHTAKFISQKMANYFLSDNPSEQLIKSMADKFLQSEGEISQVLEVLFSSKEFWNNTHPPKFRLPHEYLYSMVRLALPEKNITNYAPLWYEMGNLGEAPYSHSTPDGYGLKDADWISGSQVEKRVVWAQNFFTKICPALLNEDSDISSVPNVPATELSEGYCPTRYSSLYQTMLPILSLNTQDVVKQNKDKIGIQFLLSSPEMLYK